KDMVNLWDKQYPGRTESMFRALQNVVPSHLADTQLFNFLDLKLGDTVSEGDLAFDKEVFPNLGLNPENEPNFTEKVGRKVINILDNRK
ncbi:MAG: tRNA 2-thiocytidine(32) synthetase TtcA, partial [Neisseriaceae bacterium]|nr:tRNA 2-thiocytidine(32) synthetase TtcA [Neisseriaceae bacterium]